MRRYLLTAALLVACAALVGAQTYTETFYLAAAGDGSAPKTPAGAFDAADFNNAANWDTDVENDGKFGPCDRMITLDDDGDIRATLTIQQSGLSGCPITIQGEASGSPTVNGADLVSTWTQYTSNLLTNSDFVDWADPTFPDNWTHEGTHDVNNYVEEAPADDLHLVSDGTWTGIKQANVITIGNVVSYSVKVDTVTSGSIKVRFGGTNDIVFSTPGTHTGTTTVAGGTPGNLTTLTIARNVACSVVVDEVIVSDTYVWQATLTTDPTSVYFDGTRGTEVGSTAAVNGANEWYWNANVLYVYSPSDPDSAFTTPGIEATVRPSNLDTNIKSYLTVENLTLKYATTQGIFVKSDDATRPTDITIQSNAVSDQDNYGICVGDSGGTDLTPNSVSILSNTIQDWFRAYQVSGGPGNVTAPAIYVQDGDGSGGDSLVVRGNIIDADLASGDAETDNYRNGITVETGDDILIESNTITNVEHGIELDGTNSGGHVDTYTVRYNLVDDTSDDSLWLTGVTALDASVYYNLFSNSGDNGMHLQSCGAGGYGSIYNNVVYTTVNAAILLVFGDTRTNFKNNIVMEYGTGEGAGEVAAIKLSNGNGNLATSDFDFNLYYHSTDGTPFEDLELGSRTLAQWRTDTSTEASSDVGDPLFVAPGSNNFHLQAGSPARNAGTDLDLPRDYEGKPLAWTGGQIVCSSPTYASVIESHVSCSTPATTECPAKPTCPKDAPSMGAIEF